MELVWGFKIISSQNFKANVILLLFFMKFQKKE